jgi:hypothetical protein
MECSAMKLLAPVISSPSSAVQDAHAGRERRPGGATLFEALSSEEIHSMQ